MGSYSEDLWDSESNNSENGDVLGLYLKDNQKKIDFKLYFNSSNNHQ